MLLLLCLNGLHAAVQQVADLVFDGLPDGVAANSVSSALSQKVGANYDKTHLPADRDRVVMGLKEMGYLDADARSTVSFLPTGIRVTYAVKPRHRYTVEAVKADGVPEADLTTIIAGAKVDQRSFCTQEVIDRLAPAIAAQLGINVLYVDAEWKTNADKKQAILVLRR